MDPSLHEQEYQYATAADNDRQQVADVYAKALIGATEKAGVSEQVLSEYSTVVEAVDTLLPGAGVLIYGGIPRDDLLAVLQKALGGKVHPLLLNFLKVLTNHNRMYCLRAIFLAATERFDKLRKRIRVKVTSATPLAEAQVDNLKSILRISTGAEPILIRRIDEKLIGGLIVQVGDTVYDGSVTTQLEHMRTRLIDRSSHEIERRRDRVGT